MAPPLLDRCLHMTSSKVPPQQLRDRERKREIVKMGSGGEGGGFGWCNVLIKFLLFLTNIVLWVIGMLILALGIYILVDSNIASLESSLNLRDFLSVPAIFLIVIGAILFIIGFCGCFGALLEIFFFLVIYSAIMSLVVLLEVAGVVYVVVQTQVTMSSSVDYREILSESITTYYEDINVRDIIDILQRDLLRCCGSDGPDDWQANRYYNCSSIAFTRCSVPPSCCILENGEVINQQCGYQTLNVTSDRYLMDIYTEGCIARVDSLVGSNLYTILGVGIGLLVLQILCVLLASGLAVDVHREKKLAKAIKKQEKLEKQAYDQTSKL